MDRNGGGLSTLELTPEKKIVNIFSECMCVTERETETDTERQK